MQCKGRFCREKKELKFPAKSGYFTERRCSDIALESGDLCASCLIKSKQPFVNKNQQYFYQGKVDEPYFENSWLFGSKRFLEHNEMPGNAISAEAFAFAEAAQRIARQGLQIQETMPPKNKKEPTKTKESQGQAKQTQAKQTQAKQTQAKQTQAKQAPKTKEQPKTIEPPNVKQTTSAIAVESSEEPLEAMEVRKIPLQLITYNSTDYWLNTKNLQLYSVGPNGPKTIVRDLIWDPIEKKPKNLNPDSDSEQ